MNKKTKIAIIGVIALVLVTIGITYAYWLVTKTQTGENVITTGCLDISLNGSGDITLSNQFPLSDEDGMKLAPYTFTVTNNCNTSVDYQIALEALGDESAALTSNALKVALNDESKLFSSYAEVDTTVSGAYEARRLGFSRLSAKGSEGSTDSYSLRIWIDADASLNEMNKTFRSKITVTIGQGIELPFSEDSLAYNILSDATSITTVGRNYTPVDFSDYSEKMAYSTLYYWGTEMTFDSSTGEYKLGGTIVSASVSECRNGQKSDGTTIKCLYTMKNNTSSDYSSEKIYETSKFTPIDEEDIAQGIVVSGKQSNTAKSDFWKSLGSTSVIKTPDDLGDSYFFVGDVTNNYVKLGTWKVNSSRVYASGPGYTYNSMEECLASSFSSMCKETIYGKEGDNMYWRIVRINGDGTIRLIYAGTAASPNGESTNSMIAEKVKYDSNNEGYTYYENDEQKDSYIKEILDSWYETNIEGDIEQYIADSIFCNDRSGIDSETDSTYAAVSRQLLTPYRVNPTLKCERKEDRYTVNDTTNGNGLLTKPIGLITADELLFARSGFLDINSHFYSSGKYWTMTPYSNSLESGGSKIYCVADSIVEQRITYGYNVRPVINLKADVQFTGKGTIDSPYEILLSSEIENLG